MFEVLLDIFLIVFIIVFWYFQFRTKLRETTPTPCYVQNQQFCDPYGKVFTCDKNLVPVPNAYQPAMEYDGDRQYFNLETHTISRFASDTPENTLIYRKPGLEPLYFQSLEEEPFVIVDNKYLVRNSCIGKADGTNVELLQSEVGFLDNTLGTPYGVCKGGRVFKILNCPRYYDFSPDRGQCVRYDPCEGRTDGYVIEVNANSFSFCEGGKLQTKTCTPRETLINFECVPTPCKGVPDGTIVQVEASFNTYDYCEKEVLLHHRCRDDEFPTYHGCISNFCTYDENGLNAVMDGGLHSAFPVQCEDGKFYRVRENEEDVHDILPRNLFLWNGGPFNYDVFFSLNRGVYVNGRGWTSALYDVWAANRDVYMTFRRVPENKIFEEVFCYNFIRVQFRMTYAGIVTTVYKDTLYYPPVFSDQGELPSSRSQLQPEDQALERLAIANYKLVVFDEHTYCDLTKRPFRKMTCPEGTVVDFSPLHPCVSVPQIINDDNRNVPYTTFSALLLDPPADDTIAVRKYKVLWDKDMKVDGQALTWHDYLFDTDSDYTSPDSPFCGVQTATKYDNTWEALLRYLTFSFTQEEFDKCYFTFEPSADAPDEVSIKTVLNNAVFLEDGGLQSQWLESVDRKSTDLTVGTAYPIETESGRIYVGLIESEGRSLYIYTEDKSQTSVSINVKSLLAGVECVPKTREFGVAAIDRDNPQDILLFKENGSFARKTCGLQDDIYRRHSKMPVCVHKYCVDTIYPIVYLPSERTLFNCSNLKSESCPPGEVIVDGGCVPIQRIVQRDFLIPPNELFLQLPDVLDAFGINAVLTILRSDKVTIRVDNSYNERSFVCPGTTSIHCSGENALEGDDPPAVPCFNDLDWGDTLSFLLENCDQEAFDDLFYEIKVDAPETLDYSTDYFQNFEDTEKFRLTWLTRLSGHEPITVEAYSYKKVSVEIDPGTYVTYYALGEITDGKKTLYFHNPDNTNDTYIYFYPDEFATFAARFGIKCKARDFRLTFERYPFSNIYATSAVEDSFQTGTFENPRVKNATFQQLQAAGDNGIPFVAQQYSHQDPQ